MTNFRINFENPWFLLLLIPAIALTLISYFKLGKRYRCTRNRITSITLHIIIMVLAITVLAGMTFSYYEPNTENEVILLVDASYSTNEDSGSDVDDFIKSVIDNTDSMFKLGIVTFGYDQVYAAELSNDTTKLYSSYLESAKPNTTATDISSAITYAASLFKKPETARIVLLSDAVETDNSVLNVIKSISSQGIKIDTVHFSGKRVGDEVQIIDMVKPEEKIRVGEKFSVNVTIESSVEGNVILTPYDNNVAGFPINVSLVEGINNVVVPYTFTLPGMHEMYFEINSPLDTVEMNNSYLSYIYIEIFDDILIVESIDDESHELTSMLKEELNATVINVSDTEKMPKTLNELRAFDEVILCNISNDDMPEGFDEILQSYVRDFGGGLFTICGNEETASSGDDWTANAYTREDMYGTIYQDMLPVEIINYTPPAAVMIIIDTSGSMLTGGGESSYEGSKLFYAIQGAEACLDVLTERDYVGIMTLADSYSEEISLTPRTQRDKILSAITTLEEDAINGNTGGGTIFSAALERAGKTLSALTTVEKKHIIIVTDGEPSATDEEEYIYRFEENAELGITTSIVGIQCSTTAINKMTDILVEYAGMSEDNFHDAEHVEMTADIMREDLKVPDIKEVNYETFTPVVKDTNSPIFNEVDISEIPTLDGYYGVKIKPGANVALSGKYTPIYAEWKYGLGTVATFACDLNGTWSSEFINSEVGQAIVNNIVASLFPQESIKPTDIDAEWTGDNYTTNLSIYTDVAEGEFIEVTVTSPGVDGFDPTAQVFTAGAADGYSRLVFGVTNPGIHEILIQKKTAEGEVLSEKLIYKSLAYSKEYNMFVDMDEAEELSASIAETSGGDAIAKENPEQVFQNAAKYIFHEIDPKIPFMIIVIIFFLLDIAARKFKWKWPHEIVHDKKNKAMSK